MFVLTLPEGAPREGSCRINGEGAEYRIVDRRIEWRAVGDAEWQERNILQSRPVGDGLVRYDCDDGPGSEGPYFVITPEGVTKLWPPSRPGSER